MFFFMKIESVGNGLENEVKVNFETGVFEKLALT